MSDRGRSKLRGSSSLSVADTGEDLVRFWASQARFIVNSPLRDRTGWDHLVELSESRPAHTNAHLLGLPSLSLSARLQVKTTTGKAKRIPISLANWQRAIEDPLPWIFVLLRLSPNRIDLLEASAIHFEQPLVERVIRHFYSTSDFPKRTRSQTPSLSWSDGTTLSAPYHEALRRLIDGIVGSDHYAYAARKAGWIKSAGYSQTSARQVSFQLQAESEAELFTRISRAAVGLEDEIQVTGIKFARERFGQSRPDPEYPQLSAGKLSIRPCEADEGWSLAVLDSSRSEILATKCRMRFSGAVIPGLPEQYWIARIQTRFLDVLLDHGKKTTLVTLRLPPFPERVSPHEVSDALEFMGHVADRTQQIAQLHLRKGDRLVPLDMHVPNFVLDEEIAQFRYQAKAVSDLFHELRLDAQLQIPLGVIASMAPMAWVFLAARRRTPHAATIEWNLESGDGFQADLVTAAIVPLSLYVDRVACIEIIVLKGIPDVLVVDGVRRARLLTTDVSSYGSFRVPANDHSQFSFEERAKEIEDLLRTEGIQQVLIRELETPASTVPA